MNYFQSLKQNVFYACLFSAFFNSASSAYSDEIAVMGGISVSNLYNLTTSGYPSATPPPMPITFSPTIVSGPNSVALSTNGTLLLGGGSGGATYVYYLDTATSTTATAITGTSFGTTTFPNLAINANGLAVLSSANSSGPLAFVIDTAQSPPVVTPLSGGIIGSSTSAQFSKVAISDNGRVLLTGNNSSFAPVAYVIEDAKTTSTLTSISGIMTAGSLSGVAVSATGTAILGGRDTSMSSPAAYTLLNGANAATTLTGFSGDGQVQGVAINATDTIVLGGLSIASSPAHAIAFYLPSGGGTSLETIDTGFVPTGSLASVVNSVAINASGMAVLVGNADNNKEALSYLSLASASGPQTATVTQMGLDGTTNRSLAQVAIDTNGVAITRPGNNPIAAYLFDTAMPSLGATSLTVTGAGSVNTVAIALTSSSPSPPPPPPGPPSPPPSPTPEISTSGVSSGLLSFASYLNSLPTIPASVQQLAQLEGSDLTEALLSTSPLRNQSSTFAGIMNQFGVSKLCEAHIQGTESISQESQDLALVAGCFLKTKIKKPISTNVITPWISGFGSYAREKKQEEIPSFNMKNGGAIVGIDYCNQNKIMGLAFAYVFTSLKQTEDAGKATINQEFLNFYVKFSVRKATIDVSLWGGLYQAENERHVVYPGYDAIASSKPRGYLITPHVGLRLHHDWNWGRTEPFVNIDWANNWQKSFKETGAEGWNMGQSSQYSSMLRSEVGLNVYQSISHSTGNLILQETASYVNKTPFKVGQVTAFLVGSPGSFTSETLSGMQNLALVAMALTFVPNETRHPYIKLSYQGEFGVPYQANQVALEIGKDF